MREEVTIFVGIFRNQPVVMRIGRKGLPRDLARGYELQLFTLAPHLWHVQINVIDLLEVFAEMLAHPVES